MGKTAMFNSYVCHYQWDTIWKMVVLWENHRKLVDWLGMAYPLANQQKTDGKITILNEKTAIFNSYVSHYQWDTIWKMVVLWENHGKMEDWLGMAYLWQTNKKRMGKSQF